MSTVQVNQINNLNGNTPITVENLYQYVSYIEDIRSGDATRIARGLNGLGLKSGAVQTPGAAGGLATLDSNQRLTASQLPDTNVGRPGDLLFAPVAPTNGTWVKADGSIYSKSVYPDAAANIGPYMDFRNVQVSNLPNNSTSLSMAQDGSIVSVGTVNSNQGNIFIYRSTDGGATYTSYNTGISFYNNASYLPNVLVYANGVWLLQITGLPSSNAGVGFYLYKSTNLTTWTAFNAPSGLGNTATYYTLGAIGNIFGFIPTNGSKGNTYYTTDGTAAWASTYDVAYRNVVDDKSYGTSTFYLNGTLFLLPGFSVQPISYTTDGKVWKTSTFTASHIQSMVLLKNSYITRTNGSGYGIIPLDISSYTIKDPLGLYGETLFPEHYANNSYASSTYGMFTLFNKYLCMCTSYLVYNGSSQIKLAIIYTEDLIEWKVLIKGLYAQTNYQFTITSNNGTRLTNGRYTLSLTYDPASQFQVPIVRNNEMGMNVYPWIKLK